MAGERQEGMHAPSDTWTEDAVAAAEPTALVLPDRYEDLGPLGAGGMGEVRRVRDRLLQRTVAMKIAKGGVSPAGLARFQEEAQVSAQLQHPSIVPIHDLGELEDGRLWFTMKEVRGKTLSARIEHVHAASRRGRDQTEDGWSLRRLIDALARVGDAAAYAHARGVVHRDLKPVNVMLGGHGEVQVLDWGLARVLSMLPSPVEGGVASLRDTGDSLRTQAGAVAGTPSYMAPEQARAEHERIGPASDVWALGGMLYEVLTGRPPYQSTSREALVALVADPPPVHPPQTLAPFPVPDELAELAMRALSPLPEDRPADGGVFAAALWSWLDGAKHRERALELIHEADASLPEIHRKRSEAFKLREAATAQLAALPADASESLRWGPWALQDEAQRLEDAAQKLQSERLRLLRASLSFVADLPEAHDRLAEHYQREHVRAEQSDDHEGAARLEGLIRAHDRGRYQAYLEGHGTLSLRTDPAGAEVTAYRYVEQRRRLVPERIGVLGRTPLADVPLAMGSYLLEIRAPGRELVRYPVQIARQEHWHGVRPGDEGPAVVHLPEAVPAGMIYVPAGWAEVGTDQTEALTNPVPRQRVWVDAFFMSRDLVTNAEYIAFLHDLWDRGETERAESYAPRVGQSVIYPRDAQGRFRLGRDAQGHDWRPTMPVVYVSWEASLAYAEWLGERIGRPCRLPFELEWEKAARGVDARVFPWGRQRCAEWSWTRERAVHALGPCDVGTHPYDSSPYGARDVAGNAMNWLMDGNEHYADTQGDIATTDDPAPNARAHRARGGSWAQSTFLSRLDTSNSGAGHRPEIGLRLVCPLIQDPV